MGPVTIRCDYWPPRTEHELLEDPLRGDTRPVTGVELRSGGKVAATNGSKDHTIRLWGVVAMRAPL